MEKGKGRRCAGSMCRLGVNLGRARDAECRKRFVGAHRILRARVQGWKGGGGYDSHSPAKFDNQQLCYQMDAWLHAFMAIGRPQFLEEVDNERKLERLS
eukprot:jgi/Botrbrau1/8597/Bobra.0380s0018.1